MKIIKFSKKQSEILKFAFDKGHTLICDGAVRSGKTLTMTLAFILWAMEEFNETNFGICGKTVSSAERNIVSPLQQVEQGIYDINYKISNRCLTIRCGDKKNKFYLFGGKDESSASLIQGITLAGVLFDEVALMPRSFVEQAIARTISFRNAKLWFNCNPETPNHWFYNEWIKEGKKEAKRLHFLMRDNPILGEEEIKRAENMYSGVFYERYILGKWVSSEGLIYPSYVNGFEKYRIQYEDLPHLKRIHVGIDFGGNKSNHALTAVGFDNMINTVYVLKSRSLKAKDTSVEYILKEFVKFTNEIENEFGRIDYVYADSAEQAIINTLRYKTKYGNIKNSIKNEIINRIRCTDMLMSENRLKIINKGNEAIENGFKNAVWNPKSKEDERLDDGTSDIDILDSFEYAIEPYLKQLLRK